VGGSARIAAVIFLKMRNLEDAHSSWVRGTWKTCGLSASSVPGVMVEGFLDLVTFVAGFGVLGIGLRGDMDGTRGRVESTERLMRGGVGESASSSSESSISSMSANLPLLLFGVLGRVGADIGILDLVSDGVFLIGIDFACAGIAGCEFVCRPRRFFGEPVDVMAGGGIDDDLFEGRWGG